MQTPGVSDCGVPWFRMRWRRTGPTVGLFLLGLALVAAGVVAGLADGSLPGSEQLADALPGAGLALMACAAALVATRRTPAFDEMRGLAWVFLCLIFVGPVLASVFFPGLMVDPLVLGVLVVTGLSVAVVLATTPAPRRPAPRPTTTAFGVILAVGVVLLAVAALLCVLATQVPVLWAPAVVLGVAAAAFLAAPSALLAAGRVGAWRAVRVLATAYLVAVYLTPFVVSRLLASRSFDALALWLLNLVIVASVLFIGAVVVATLAYDSALRRRRSRQGAVSR